MQFTPRVVHDGDAYVGQRLSTLVDLHELGAPPDLLGSLEAVRDHIALQPVRPSHSLFVGAPGYGQALAAASLGKALSVPVFRIDLSGVVSRYIGETEKNLDRLFGQAEDANSILFFDEADALFGKRTDVHDAHDRYGNAEVAYVLQKLEAYAGPAILATSSRMNIDPAFLRRLRYVLYFHTPLQPPKRPEAADPLSGDAPPPFST
jgi:SpoVK/Ycf46/Vps4 family AAA+-type ATPase